MIGKLRLHGGMPVLSVSIPQSLHKEREGHKTMATDASNHGVGFFGFGRS
jgi:hypothetical protein